jgi:hypothetical protein
VRESVIAERNVDIVRGVIEAWASDDLDRFLEYCGEDIGSSAKPGC